jgi:hypothetical protein
MHNGCSGQFGKGRDVLHKVRAMGFSSHFLPQGYSIPCPHCGAEHVVTPCHGHDPQAIVCVL